jgi:hypothetical protein
MDAFVIRQVNSVSTHQALESASQHWRQPIRDLVDEPEQVETTEKYAYGRR